MRSYYHEPIAQLAHELSLSPVRHRPRQVTGIGRAIDLIDPAKEYPYSLICFTITGYRPRRTAETVLSGGELMADLVELLDALTAATPLPPDFAEGSLYEADALAKRLNVSVKTISRWRKRGLAGCWYSGGAGKPRFAYSGRSIERFVCGHRDLVLRGGTFQLMGDDEKAHIIARARELVATKKCTLHRVTQQLSEETGRAVETIRYTLRRFDREHPELALFDRAEQPQPIDERTVIFEAYAAGETVAGLAQRFGRKPHEITRIVTRERAERIARQPIDYVYNAVFESPDAESLVSESPLASGRADDEADPTLGRVPAELPPYLQALYRTPLLTKAEEAHLFRRMNFILHQAAVVRGRFADDPSRASAADIAGIDEKLEGARRIRNRIIQSNLRLVVSIAKRHLRAHAGANLFDLVSDGNLTLMKAVEKFDYAKGFAFSTYATWAIIRGYARSIPEQMTQADRFQTGRDEFLSAARDHRPLELPAEEDAAALRESLQKGLGALEARERGVIERHYGLGDFRSPATLDQIGRELGLSKERVRQIELSALAKLRGNLAPHRAALMAG
jgi:RNA polymerase sigma factor (sigma-70 family)